MLLAPLSTEIERILPTAASSSVSIFGILLKLRRSANKSFLVPVAEVEVATCDSSTGIVSAQSGNSTAITFDEVSLPSFSAIIR